MRENSRSGANELPARQMLECGYSPRRTTAECDRFARENTGAMKNSNQPAEYRQEEAKMNTEYEDGTPTHARLSMSGTYCVEPEGIQRVG
jgi:hypothetical protein